MVGTASGADSFLESSLTPSFASALAFASFGLGLASSSSMGHSLFTIILYRVGSIAKSARRRKLL